MVAPRVAAMLMMTIQVVDKSNTSPLMVEYQEH
jgi:hypothetical protein